MPKTNQLALCIYKGASLNEQQPTLIVSTGDLPKGFRPVYPTKVDEKEMWTVTHAQEYTLYAYFTKKYRIADDTPGILSVYLMLPAAYRLAESRSPLGLIDTIVDMLSVNDMPNDIMPQSEVSPNMYKMLLDRCELENRPRRLPLMQGKKAGTLQLKNRTQLDAMFRYSSYPQFNRISCLEMGYKCDTTVQISAAGKTQPSSTTKPDAGQKDTDTPTDASKGEYGEKKPTGWTTLDTHDERKGSEKAHKKTISQVPSLFSRLKGIVIKTACAVAAVFIMLCIVGYAYDKWKENDESENLQDPIACNENKAETAELAEDAVPAKEAAEQAADEAANAEQELKKLEELKQKEEVAKAKAQAEAEAKVRKVELKAEILNLLKQKKKVNLNDPKYKGVLTRTERNAVDAIQDPVHAVRKKNADGTTWKPNGSQMKKAQMAIYNATINSWDDVMSLSRTIVSVLQAE